MNLRCYCEQGVLRGLEKSTFVLPLFLRFDRLLVSASVCIFLARRYSYIELIDYAYLREQHGPHAIRKIRQFVNPKSRHASFLTNLQFNLHCRGYGAIPKSLRLSLLVSPLYGQVNARAEKCLIQARFLEVKATKKRLGNDILITQCFIEHLLPLDFFDVLLHANSHSAGIQERKPEPRHEKFTLLFARHAAAAAPKKKDTYTTCLGTSSTLLRNVCRTVA